MNTPVKSSPSSPAATRGHLFRVAVVGAASLKGKEVADFLNERNFPATDVRLLDDDAVLGQLESVGDEMNFIQSVRPEQFEHVDFAFFAGDPASTRKCWKMARNAGSTIVDLSGALEDEPGASVRSLWMEREMGLIPPPELQPAPCVAAHPAALMLGLLLLRLQKVGTPARAVATVFEPASGYDQKGMDELHQQTVNLLSFQPLPKDVYDAQLAFNLLASYGSAARTSLASVEARILRHLHHIGGPQFPELSLILLQAPVFHGQALALFVQMSATSDLDSLRNAISGEHIVVAAKDDLPNNVSAAGQGDILVGLRQDSTQAGGFWLWAVADNLRIAAINAVECAESMAATRPVGKIQ